MLFGVLGLRCDLKSCSSHSLSAWIYSPVSDDSLRSKPHQDTLTSLETKQDLFPSVHTDESSIGHTIIMNFRRESSFEVCAMNAQSSHEVVGEKILERRTEGQG